MNNFLGESEQRTRSIFDNVVDGIITIDERGTIQAINPAGERIFGYRSAELIGQNVSMLMPENDRLVHDECIASYLRTGEAKIIGVGREVTGLRHDGSDFPMDLSIGEFRDGDHRFFTGIVRDITARKQAERVSATLAAIVESSDDAIVAKDLAGVITAWNGGAERLFGYSAAEMIGQPIAILIPADRECEVAAIMARLWNGERVEQFDSVRVTKCGTRVDVSLTISPIRDDSGRIVGASKIARDITKRRETEESLRRYASRLEKLREIDLAILASQSTREIAAAALEHLERLVPCWTGVAMIYDLDGGEAEVIGSVGVSRQWHPPGTRVPHGLGGRDEQDAIRRGPATVVVDDTAGEVSGSLMMESLRAGGMRSFVLMQLSDRTELIGSLLLGSDSLRAYSSDSVDAVREVAGQLGVAIRQALLLEDVRWAKARLECLSRQLIRTQEDEQRRIARELHDEVGQTLTASKIVLDRLVRDHAGPSITGRLEDASALVARALEQVRNLSRLLRPSLLDDLGLTEALRALAEGMADRAGCATLLKLDEVGRADPEVETVFYRIAQEALNNAVKHSGATRLGMALRRTGDDLELVVEDDGIGFDVRAARERAVLGGSLGLLGMHERATLVGGRAEIDSLARRGTRVRVVATAGGRPSGPPVSEESG